MTDTARSRGPKVGASRPKVMDTLMPHMIGDVVPLVTQPLIDHLRAKKLRAAG